MNCPDTLKQLYSILDLGGKTDQAAMRTSSLWLSTFAISPAPQQIPVLWWVRMRVNTPLARVGYGSAWISTPN